MPITAEDIATGRVTRDDEDGPLMDPIHPGEHLAKFMADLELSARALARAINVPHNRILAIVAGRRSITGETALRLARYLGTTPQLWLGLQAEYDREVAERKHGEAIRQEVRPLEREAA